MYHSLVNYVAVQKIMDIAYKYMGRATNSKLCPKPLSSCPYTSTVCTYYHYGD